MADVNPAASITTLMWMDKQLLKSRGCQTEFRNKAKSNICYLQETDLRVKDTVRWKVKGYKKYIG